ncbi:UDP-glucuronosyltransferase 2A3-like [Amphiura filiformis]|uniref:UDP-glucuronosyltransferase 2A3-like n=1 Tax=Amphiura filiformis TaxID=82378 RepID=UPI003B21346E
MAAVNMYHSCTLLIVALCFVSPLYGYRFLILGGDGSGSHFYVATAIGQDLAQRGHNVTVVISDMYADDPSSTKDGDLFKYYVYKSLVTKERFQKLVADIVDISLGQVDFTSVLKLNALAEVLMRDQCKSIFIDMPILERLKEEKFDLIIGDLWYICVGLVAQFMDVPFVTLTPHGMMSIQSQVNMCPTNPAFIPDMITGLDTKMTFMERVVNTLTVTLNSFMNRRMLLHYDQLKIKHNIKPEISTFKTLGQAEFWFINTHFVLDFPRPLMPNAVAVGGLTTRPARPLEKDLDSFMQSSDDDGVIIFSLGSYASITKQELADLIGDTFAQIPQKVIWRARGKIPRNPPKNVKFMDVIPQNDLLGHPKTKLLIYQCGLNGVYEAIYHGVPIICLPIFFDQYDNAQRVASRGIGLRLNIADLTSDILLEAIHAIFDDDKYRTNMARVSSIFRDDPKTPPQRAADWAEFAVKHGGAHLRSAAHDLTFWQYHLVDVWAFLIGCLVAILILLFSMCRCVFRVCSSRKAKQE